MRRSESALVALAILAGLVLIALGVVYWVEPAGRCPPGSPGHEAGSGHHHIKHGIASFLARRRAARLRVVPDRPEAARSDGLARMPLAEPDQLLAGDRARPRAGRHRAVPDLEPRPQRDPAQPARLGHPPERRLLHHVPGRHPPRDRDRAASSSSGATGCGSSPGSAAACATVESAPDDADAKLGWLLVVGTIPAGILGLLLEHALRSVFASRAVGGVLPDPQRAAAVRRGGAAPPRARDRRRRRRAHRRTVAFAQALGVGAAQALALIPGFSRSGATMAGGLVVGLSHRDAARFAFLLATPIIGAAALLKLPELPGRRGTASAARRSSPRSARRVSAYVAVRFLLRWFETRTLIAVRCLVRRVRRRDVRVLRGQLVAVVRSRSEPRLDPALRWLE